MTPDRERVQLMALHSSSCVLCGHSLIDHHYHSLRCQVATKRHWWSRRVQCACEMRPA